MLIISITEINCDYYLILCITENAKRDNGRSAKHEHVLIEMFLENIFCSEKIEVLSLLLVNLLPSFVIVSEKIVITFNCFILFIYLLTGCSGSFIRRKQAWRM